MSLHTTALGDDPGGSLDERARARGRLLVRRQLRLDAVAYLVVNVFLTGVWALTGAGYFWPGWVIGGWSVGVVGHAWNVYWRRPVTDEAVDAELRRDRR